MNLMREASLRNWGVSQVTEEESVLTSKEGVKNITGGGNSMENVPWDDKAKGTQGCCYEMLRQGRGCRSASVGMLALGSWCRNAGLGSKWGEDGCELWPEQRAEVWQAKQKAVNKTWAPSWCTWRPHAVRLAEDQTPCQREDSETHKSAISESCWPWGLCESKYRFHPEESRSHWTVL